MGMDPVTIGLIVGGVSAASSAASAAAQNSANRKSAAVANANAKTEAAINKQSADMAAKEKEREAAQILGHLKVLGADSGGGELTGYEIQSSSDLSRETGIIDINRKNRDLQINSQLESVIASIGARMRSPFLDAIAGGSQGFVTGLSIGRAFPGSGAGAGFGAGAGAGDAWKPDPLGIEGPVLA